jgi:hypothetical protein
VPRYPDHYEFCLALMWEKALNALIRMSRVTIIEPSARPWHPGYFFGTIFKLLFVSLPCLDRSTKVDL